VARTAHIHRLKGQTLLRPVASRSPQCHHAAATQSSVPRVKLVGSKSTDRPRQGTKNAAKFKLLGNRQSNVLPLSLQRSHRGQTTATPPFQVPVQSGQRTQRRANTRFEHQTRERVADRKPSRMRHMMIENKTKQKAAATSKQ
jgi:hypothetical protein